MVTLPFYKLKVIGTDKIVVSFMVIMVITSGSGIMVITSGSGTFEHWSWSRTVAVLVLKHMVLGGQVLVSVLTK